jgi:hypothetical protein
MSRFRTIPPLRSTQSQGGTCRRHICIVHSSAGVQQPPPNTPSQTRPEAIVCAVTDQRFMFSASHHKTTTPQPTTLAVTETCRLSSFLQPWRDCLVPSPEPSGETAGLADHVLVSRQTQAQTLVCQLGCAANRRHDGPHRTGPDSPAQRVKKCGTKSRTCCAAPPISHVTGGKFGSERFIRSQNDWFGRRCAKDEDAAQRPDSP